MFNKIKIATINTKLYGDVNVYLDRKNMICNGYHVSTIMNNTEISGLVDKNGKEVINLGTHKVELFHETKDKKHAFLGYKMQGYDNLCYYVVKASNDGLCNVVGRLSPNNKPPLEFLAIKNNDKYWIVSTIENTPSFMLYDIEKNKQVSIAFDELVSLDREKRIEHRFYYSLDINSTVDEGNTKTLVTHSSLCGFLDDDANLSSDILDTESMKIYSAKMFGPNTKSDNFKNLIGILTKKYSDEYNRKQELVNEKLSIIYNAPSPDLIVETYDKPAKIIEFNNTRKKV